MNSIWFRLKSIFRRIYIKLRMPGSASYWSNHMVAHENWAGSKTSEDSLNHFHWRNSQYLLH